MTEELSTKIRSILEAARFAPSVHNSQPWIVKQEGATLHISIDPEKSIKYGDPTGRETIISLGIFVETICCVAEEQGLLAKDIEFKNNQALIHFSKASSVLRNQSLYSTLLKTRCTDRTIFHKIALNKKAEHSISSSKVYDGTDVHLVTDPETIELTATLTSKAIKLALNDPFFRRELLEYLVLPWFSKRRGISLLALGIPVFIAILEPLFLRLRWGLNMQGKIEKRRWMSASGIVFITAKGDMPQFWFATGRTYLRSSLEIERQGLSQATSAAIVEASNYHDDIEELIGTKDRIMTVTRIGQGTRRRHHSPRVSVNTLLH
jgi:hypothetical protein